LFQAQKTHVEYYNQNDEKLVFPLAVPITAHVKHVYYVVGWKSCKWGPAPNMDGTPSTESFNSAVVPLASESSTANNSAGLIRPFSPRPSAPALSITTRSVDAVVNAKTAPASQSQPTNSVRAAKKTPTVSCSIHTLKSLRKSGGVVGDFEVVNTAELDDEFDVVDSEGPSAANGALSTGWEDDEQVEYGEVEVDKVVLG
jgi:hypothetical protein